MKIGIHDLWLSIYSNNACHLSRYIWGLIASGACPERQNGVCSRALFLAFKYRFV